MGNVAIVAIPNDEDYVWKISSEKIPHMTILNLGGALSDEDMATVMGYVQHAANTSLKRFGLSVDKRGKLGVNDADVIFFDPNSWSLDDVKQFRMFLLREDKIHTAVDLTPQFENWVPHLTLGYPETPAKPDPREYPGIHNVYFDRIALWVDNYSGPEFELKTDDADSPLVMSSSDDGALEHWGIKGMQWGVRRTREQRAAAAAKLHADHSRARDLMKKKVSELSNEELSFVNQRRQLEANYSKLNPSKSARRKQKIKNNLDTLKLAEEVFSATQQPVAQRLIKKGIKSVNSPKAKKILKAFVK